VVWSLLMGKREEKKKAHKPKPRFGSKLVEKAFGPPLLEEEKNANLTELERSLNAQMKCPAGKNQVFLRSLLTGNGTTQPRIALKCSLRRDIHLKPEVYYEHIRDVCCCDPKKCEAYRRFKDRFVQT